MSNFITPSASYTYNETFGQVTSWLGSTGGTRTGERLKSSSTSNVWGSWDTLATEEENSHPMIGFYLLYDTGYFNSNNGRSHSLELILDDTAGDQYILKHLPINVYGYRKTVSVYYPLFVPGGYSISGRVGSSDGLDVDNRPSELGVSIIPVLGSVNENDGCYGKHEIVGQVDFGTGLKRGTNIANASSIDTWTSWTYIGNTNFRWEGWLPSFQPVNNQGNFEIIAQIVAGDPTDTNYTKMGGTKLKWSANDDQHLADIFYPSTFKPCNFPAGLPIYVRYAASGLNSGFYFSVEGIG